MLRKIILSLITVNILTSGFGQAGFLGALNSIEGNIWMVPSLKRTNTMELDGENAILNERIRIVNPSYSINYSRVLNRQFELSVGFGFSRQRSFQISSYPVQIVSGNSEKNYLLMEDFILNQRGLNLEVRKFVKGNIAPIGKYLGFNLSVSQTSLKNNQELIYADFLAVGESSFINRRKEVKNLVYGDTLSAESLNGFSIAFTYGNNMIIGDNLIFNYAIAMPLISIQSTGNLRNRGIFEYDDGSELIEDNDLSTTFFNTYRKYNGLRLQLGIKYFF
jgi:hypothetical protein